MATTTTTAHCSRCNVENPEPARLFDDRVVCQKCFDWLESASRKVGRNPSDLAVADKLVCQNPNCGHRGKVVRRRRGSVGLLILLFLAGVLPGLIYAMFGMGEDKYCPQCNMKQR
jgi:hypothetical protein